MYFQPYGDDQQLNLNWIINEIIELHKQLDPDYETPSFTQVYPYSNLNRLNLDWILSELKTLKELAPEPTPAIDIQAVAETLVALPFDSNTSYQIYDFISRDGEIWRATETIAAGGAWDETKWFKTKLGTDLAVLERWINTINNSLTAEIDARQQADTTLQTNINNEALARQQADTALQNTINSLTSANISDDSDAGGATVKASLNLLKGSLNANESAIAIVADGSTHAAIASGQYVFVKNNSTLAEGLYKATAAIPLNGTISTSNVTAVSSGGFNDLKSIFSDVETVQLNSADMTFDSGMSLYDSNRIMRIGKFCILVLSIKLENITSTAAKNISNYFPIGWRPNALYSCVVETGLADGKAQPVKIQYANRKLTIFPVNTGTTYAIGTVAYICE